MNIRSGIYREGVTCYHSRSHCKDDFLFLTIHCISQFFCRFEVVVTSRWLLDILNCRLDMLMKSVKSKFLLVQVE